ncbi:MAG: ATP-binding protein [Legionellaceae bacterium]|nr:ATP-binding protein [Legionellaceae bacterium]
MNDQALLELLLAEFHDKFKLLHDFVPRDACFPELENKINVAIGMRRTGKTYFIFQKIAQLIQAGVAQTQILYLNLEDDRLLPLTQRKLAGLLDSFYSLYPENHEKKCFLFLDEIQNVDDWALVVRRMFDSKPVEIYLTGSSAKLLSKEIATSLRGRSLATEIWPYCFREYLVAQHHAVQTKPYGAKVRDNLMQLFRHYLEVGGFPEVTDYDQGVRDQTLQDYVTIVTYRDIVERYNIVNPEVIKYMIVSMIANIAKPFSINKFYNDLKSQGYKINKDSLYDYAQHIEDAFLAFSVPLYSESIRKVRVNPKKIYAIDTGLIRAMTLEHTKDLGRLFENLIYLDLRRQGATVYYYLTQERYEVDFLVHTRQGKKELIQVTWDMTNLETKQREERALAAAMAELKIPGRIVTLDAYLRDGLNV